MAGNDETTIMPRIWPDRMKAGDFFESVPDGARDLIDRWPWPGMLLEPKSPDETEPPDQPPMTKAWYAQPGSRLRFDGAIDYYPSNGDVFALIDEAGNRIDLTASNARRIAPLTCGWLEVVAQAERQGEPWRVLEVVGVERPFEPGMRSGFLRGELASIGDPDSPHAEHYASSLRFRTGPYEQPNYVEVLTNWQLNSRRGSDGTRLPDTTEIRHDYFINAVLGMGVTQIQGNLYQHTVPDAAYVYLEPPLYMQSSVSIPKPIPTTMSHPPQKGTS